LSRHSGCSSRNFSNASSFCGGSTGGNTRAGSTRQC
jgi:hypothetical protein